MAKATITIIDNAEGGVSVTGEPSCAQLIRKMQDGKDLSSAETYHMYMLRNIFEKSKEQEEQKSRIIKPKKRFWL